MPPLITDAAARFASLPDARRRRWTLAVSLLLVALIAGFRFAAGDTDEPISVLYVIPIAVIASEFGVRAGLAAALFCFGLFQLAVTVTDITASALDDLIRLLVFVSVALMVGLTGARLRHALAEVERSSTVMRTIGNASPDAIYAKGPDGRYTVANAAAAAFVGREPEEVTGRTDAELMSADEAAQSLELDERAVAEDRIVDVKRVLSRDGEDLHFRGYTGPLRTANGELLGVFGVVRDVTAMVRTGAVRRIHLEATRLVAEMPEPEELGERLLDVLVDGTVIRDGRLLPPGEHAGAGHREGETALVLEAGGQDFGALRLEPASRADGGEAARTLIGGVAAMVEQYLERRVAERESERVKNEFFGLISHELRSPLTSILGYTELLAELEADALSERGQRFIEVIDRNARRQLRLVQDLLLLVRLEGGRFDLEEGDADLGAVIEAACEGVRPAAEAKDVEVHLAAEPLGTVRCDSVRLGQAVDNLLTNAVKFTSAGGRVDVTLERAGSSARIAVADSGIGVAPEEVDRLFDRLFRASSAVEHQIQGTGLGLTIVKAVAEAHGGSVSVESELGRGTTFTLDLPILDRIQTTAPAGPGRGVPTR